MTSCVEPSHGQDEDHLSKWLTTLGPQLSADFHTRPTSPNLRWLRRSAKALHMDSFGVDLTEEQAWTLSEEITAAVDEIVRLRGRLRRIAKLSSPPSDGSTQ